MIEFQTELNDLGYDLLGLQKVVYEMCTLDLTCGDRCTGGCTKSCVPSEKKDAR